jgi:hypothetical protein
MITWVRHIGLLELPGRWSVFQEFSFHPSIHGPQAFCSDTDKENGSAAAISFGREKER